MQILIVDDNEPLAQNIAEILEHEGHQVATASSAEEALEWASRMPLEGALLDIRMPGMDGVELFEHLQAIHPRATYCLMTAHAIDQRVEQAVANGIKTVLSKPLCVDDLIACVSTANVARLPSKDLDSTSS